MVNMAIRRDRKDCSKLSLKVRTCIVAQQCCVRLDGAKSLTRIKLCTTTSNNTQQGVHADATCKTNIVGVVGQQCCVRLYVA